MDIPRPENKRRKRIRQAAFGTGAALLLAVVTVALSRLEPAAPTVDRNSVWTDTVRRGEMLRQVRGPGVLVPREIRWIPAQTEGRVDRVLVRPGADVTPDTVLVEMSDPELMRMAEEARYELEAAEAELTEMELALQSEQLNQRAALATARAEYEQARLQAEMEKAAGEIIPLIQRQRSEIVAEQRRIQVEVEEER